MDADQKRGRSAIGKRVSRARCGGAGDEGEKKVWSGPLFALTKMLHLTTRHKPKGGT